MDPVGKLTSWKEAHGAVQMEVHDGWQLLTHTAKSPVGDVKVHVTKAEMAGRDGFHAARKSGQEVPERLQKSGTAQTHSENASSYSRRRGREEKDPCIVATVQ